MGNLATQIQDRVDTQSVSSLRISYSQLYDVYLTPQQLYDPQKVASMPELDVYPVKPRTEPPSSSKAQLDAQHLFKPDASLDLADCIRAAPGLITDDPSLLAITHRLQALCRMHEGLLRQRKLKKTVTATTSSGRKDKILGLNFCVSSLMIMIKRTSVLDPGLVDEVLEMVEDLVRGLEPLALINLDSAAEAGIHRFIEFCLNLQEPRQKRVALKLCLEISILTGNIGSTLAVVNHLLDGEMDVKELRPFVAKLAEVNVTPELRRFVGGIEGIMYTNNHLTITREGNGWHTVFCSEEIKSGKKYYELKVDYATGLSIQLGICEGGQQSLSDPRHADSPTYTYGSDGVISRFKDRSVLSKKYTTGDTIGMLVDMHLQAITFYKNGEIVWEQVSFKLTVAKILCSLNTTAAQVTLHSSPTPPDGIEVAPPEKPPTVSEFVPMQLPPGDSLSSTQTALCILSHLHRLNRPFLKYIERFGKASSLESFEPFVLSAHESTLHALNTLLQRITNDPRGTPEVLVRSVTDILALHLLHLKSSSNITIRSELLKGIYLALQNLIDNSKELSVVKRAAKLMSGCTEVFFPKAADLLDYLVTLLNQYMGSADSVLQEIAMTIFKKLQHPFDLYDLFDLKLVAQDQLEKFVCATATAAKNQSLQWCSTPSGPFVQILNSALYCLFSQAVNSGFCAEYQAVLQMCVPHVAVACAEVVTSMPPDTPEEQVSNTVLFTTMATMVYSLSLCKLSSETLAKLLPPITSYFREVSSLPLRDPQQLVVSQVKERTVESEHPYPNAQLLVFSVKIPNTTKYILKFADQCETQQGRDVLRLFPTEHFLIPSYQWTGRNFPKEPLEIKKPGLHFCFMSDLLGSAWGWKITIEAHREQKAVQMPWPNYDVEACGYFIVEASKQLIKVTQDEAPELSKAYANPLIRSGIRESAIAQITDLPSISQELLQIVKSLEKSPARSSLDTSELFNLKIETYPLEEFIEGPRESGAAWTPFVAQCLEADPNLTAPWRSLKEQANVRGPVYAIGGEAMEKGELALFGLCVGLFDLSEVVQSVFEGSTHPGSTLKFIVTKCCSIRRWAQATKQERLDRNLDVTYIDLANEIRAKCTFILNSEYKQALNEIGVNSLLSKLVQDIQQSQLKKQGTRSGLSSKWQGVKQTVLSMKRLNSLVQMRKSVSQTSPEKGELTKVFDLVLELMNTDMTALVSGLKVRRECAFSRAAGLSTFVQAIRQLSSSLVSVGYMDCFALESYKTQLEAVDPALVYCVRDSFYNVYSGFMNHLTEVDEDSGTLLTSYKVQHFLLALFQRLEKGDEIALLDLPFAEFFELLKQWAKGYHPNYSVKKVLDLRLCVTSVQLVLESERTPDSSAVLILEPPESDKVYLNMVRGEAGKQPITEIKLAPAEEPGYENAVGTITLGTDQRFVLIKRLQEEQLPCLTGMSPMFVPEYSSYESLCTVPEATESEELKGVQMNISRLSFALLKFYLQAFKGLARNKALDSLQQILIDSLMRDISQVSPTQVIESCMLGNLMTGRNWVGALALPKSYTVNPVSKYLTLIRHECGRDQGLTQLVESYLNKIDPQHRGVLPIDSLSHKQREAISGLPVTNSKGEVDFFIYLQYLKTRATESTVLAHAPLDYSKAPVADLTRIEPLLNSILSKLNSTSALHKILTLISEKGSPPGIVLAKNISVEHEAECRNQSGNLDLFRVLRWAKKVGCPELASLFAVHEDLPESCEALYRQEAMSFEYYASVLLNIRAHYTAGVGVVLADPSHLTVLLKHFFHSDSSSLLLSTALLLERILPEQHSPETIEKLWTRLESYSSFLGALLARAGLPISMHLAPQTEPLQALKSQESLNILFALCRSERWLEPIRSYIQNCLGTMSQPPTAEQIGAVYFLACWGPEPAAYDLRVTEGVRLRLKDASVSEGIVWKVDGSSVVLFNEFEDAFHTEPLSKIDIVFSRNGHSPLDRLSTEEVGTLFRTVYALWNSLQSQELTNSSSDPRLAVSLCFVNKKVETLMLETLSFLSNKKNGIQSVSMTRPEEVQKYCEITRLIEQRLKDKTASEAIYTLSTEALEKKIRELPKELASIVGELEDLGYLPAHVLAAIEAGHHTREAILQHCEGIHSRPLVQLTKWTDLEAIDLTDTGLFYQTSTGQMVIVNSSTDKKLYIKKFDDSIFASRSWFVSRLTILLTVGHHGHKAHYGVKVGNLDINFQCILERTLISVNGGRTTNIPSAPHYSLKIEVAINGEIRLSGESFEFAETVRDLSVFTGTQLGNLALYITEGEKALLKGFAVYEGLLSKSVKYWTDQTDPPMQPGREVSVTTQVADKVSTMLSFTGAPLSLCKQLARECVEISQATHTLLDQDSDAWPVSLKPLQPLFTVVVFDCAGLVPPDFEIVQVFEDGMCYLPDIPNRKVLAVKRALPNVEQGIQCIGLEPFTDSTQIGELTLDLIEGNANGVWVKEGSEEKIYQLLLVKTSTPLKVSLPLEFAVVKNKDGQAINIAPPSVNYFLFLAYQSTPTLIGCPIQFLNSVKPPVSNYGMVESLQPVKASKTSPEESCSIIQLYKRLIDIEEKHLQKSGRNFMLTIITSDPKAFISLAESRGLKYMLDLFQGNYSALQPSIQQMLEQRKHAQALVGYAIAELCQSFMPSPTGVKSLEFESTHPYENNSNLHNKIHIPEATQLVIEFDSQCNTESGCDFLRFYRDEEMKDLICEYSGAGSTVWKSLEVPGDTVYVKFSSDSSVNAWGYKFTVTSDLVASNTENQPNTEAAVFIYEEVSKSMPSTIPIRKEVLLPCLLSVFTLSDFEKKKRMLNCLECLLKHAKVDCISDLLTFLLSQADSVYLSHVLRGLTNPLLPSLFSILLPFFVSGVLQVSQTWFIDKVSCFTDMHGLTHKDACLDLLLFKYFIDAHPPAFKKIVESSHPYSKTPLTRHIKFPGASSIQLEFDQRSALEQGHEYVISFDKAAKHLFQESASGVDDSAVGWDPANKKHDIVLSNNNRTVHRTSSNNWGVAHWSVPFEKDKHVLVVHIDNTDSSEYWYMGVTTTKPSYTVDFIGGSDGSIPCWAWKRTGEFHRPGQRTHKPHEGQFGIGDRLRFEIDMSTRTLTCFKGELSVHTFKDLPESVIFFTSMGGSSQFATVASYRNVNSAGGPLSQRSITVPSDSFYIHFPVNVGYNVTHSWESAPSAEISASHFLRKRAGESPHTYLTKPSLEAGRYYIEVNIARLAERENIMIGLVPEGFDLTQNLVSNHTAVYRSPGNAFFLGKATSCKGFREGDNVGVFLDFEQNIVSFFKNKFRVANGQLTASGTPLRFAVMLTSTTQHIQLVQSPALPEEVDLLGLTVQTKEVSQEWGLRLKASPTFSYLTPSAIPNVLEQCDEEYQASWEQFLSKYKQMIVGGSGSELVAFLDEYSVSTETSVFAFEELRPSASALIYYKTLERRPSADLLELYKILKCFNLAVSKSLKLFDLAIPNVASMTDMQRAVLGSREFIFFSVKDELFKSVLEKTKCDLMPEITIDRAKAMRNKQKGVVDRTGQLSIFGQIFRQFGNRINTEYRNPQRIFKVSYRGEGSIDAGGPYNEVMSNMCDELQSQFLTLLVPSQNQVHNIGDCRDAFVLNPAATSRDEKELVRFFGKLLGVAIRTQNNLNISLAPLVWKRLVFELTQTSDLKSMDECCFQMLSILRDLHGNGINEDSFELTYADETFAAADSSGTSVELKPGGKNQPVTFGNAKEFADCLERMRLTEAEDLYCLLREGMRVTVPVELLYLYTWKQLEAKVCGTADIDVDLLRANTDYSQVSPNDRHVEYFWAALREMTPHQRQLFLKFIWGRSRLPASREFTRMKIGPFKASGPIDKYLPVTHTCFFTIDLPAYSSKAVMKERLLYAITHCQAIDLDNTPAEAGFETD